MTAERRYLAQEFRVSQDATPVIDGYAAVFDVSSADMGWIEEIDPHAFDAVMASSPDVRALWNHNPDFPLGRTAAKTLSLALDARGLAYTLTAPDTSYARDLVVSMKRGDVTQSSFSFVVARDQWTDNPDGTVTRRILEFDSLIDVSPVTFPAFDQTSATARSLPESMPVEMRSRFEKRALTDQCTCSCPQCLAGSCGICSAEPRCSGAERKSAPDTWHDDAMLRLRLAEAQ